MAIAERLSTQAAIIMALCEQIDAHVAHVADGQSTHEDTLMILMHARRMLSDDPSGPPNVTRITNRGFAATNFPPQLIARLVA